MPLKFQKTSKGRHEIVHKHEQLSRAARTLLLIIDGSRSMAEWSQLIQGLTQRDLDGLLAKGLIQAVPRSMENAPLHEQQQQQQSQPSMAPTPNTLDHEQLYTLLTSQAKERLGLIKGFMFVLEIEKCDSKDALRKLAARFVTLVGQAQGERAANSLRQAFGIAP
jgi:hypothetical protein